MGFSVHDGKEWLVVLQRLEWWMVCAWFYHNVLQVWIILADDILAKVIYIHRSPQHSLDKERICKYLSSFHINRSYKDAVPTARQAETCVIYVFHCFWALLGSLKVRWSTNIRVALQQKNNAHIVNMNVSEDWSSSSIFKQWFYFGIGRSWWKWFSLLQFSRSLCKEPYHSNVKSHIDLGQ